jgi:hypothetical protein
MAPEGEKEKDGSSLPFRGWGGARSTMRKYINSGKLYRKNWIINEIN